MSEKRCCDVCQAGVKECYVKRAEDIKESFEDPPKSLDGLSEKEIGYYRDIGQILLNAIHILHEEARDANCIDTNRIEQEKRFDKYFKPRD